MTVPAPKEPWAITLALYLLTLAFGALFGFVGGVCSTAGEFKAGCKSASASNEVMRVDSELRCVSAERAKELRK